MLKNRYQLNKGSLTVRRHNNEVSLPSKTITRGDSLAGVAGTPDIASTPLGNLQAAIAQKRASRVSASSAVSGGRTRETADLYPSFGGGNTAVQVQPLGGVGYNKFFTGITTEAEELLIPYYRDCYYYDSVAGACVDLMGTFPFSEWTLVGLEKEELAIYGENLARLNIRSMLAEISHSYLVDGAFIGTPIYDPNQKSFIDVLIHDRSACQVSPRPLFSLDPVITANSTQFLQGFMDSGSPFVDAVLSTYPRNALQPFLDGATVLDPLGTIYIGRSGARDQPTASYLKRLLPMYLLEKSMYRGTLIEATKRMRAMSHVQVGTDSWEPTPQEMMAVLGNFQTAEIDPLGSWIVTRQGVNVQDVRCLAGKTLIHTERGMRRIDELVSHDPDTLEPGSCVNLNIRVKGLTGEFVRTAKWWYQGKKPTVTVTVSSGLSITPTKNHKFLTVKDGETQLVTAAELQPGATWLLQEIGGRTADYDQELQLDDPEVEDRPSNLDTLVPHAMTPSLAYVLGLIVSEGYFRFSGVEVVNTNVSILERYCEHFEKAFGIKPGVQKVANAGVRFGLGTYRNCKAVYSVVVNNRKIVGLLRQMGLTPAKELRETCTDSAPSPSYKKTIPWCVTQANRECRLAFIASYVDGDGSIRGKKDHCEMYVCSTSKSILRGFQIMLADLGYTSSLDLPNIRLNLRASESHRLATELSTLCFKAEKFTHLEPSRSHFDGIPADVFVPLLQERQIKGIRVGPDGSTGAWFLDDDHRQVFIKGGWTELFRPFIYRACANSKENSRSFLRYDEFEAGNYAAHLSVIKAISPRLHATLCKLAKLKLQFVKVIKVKESATQHVYDLTMNEEDGPPLFIANSLVTKNSGGDFWKWTDLIDVLVPYKLRALGISEAFLSGDANFNTAEAALTVFTENADAYRSMFTHKLFRDKLFPLIAVVNGFYKDKAKVAKKKDLQSIMANLGNHRNLRIPELRWHKNLENHDPGVMQVLTDLSEKGIPVPLKMWAAAGNVSMDMLLGDLEEDTEIRAKIEKITGKSMDNAAPTGGDDMGEFAGMGFQNASLRELEGRAEIRSLANPALSRRRSLLQRSFTKPNGEPLVPLVGKMSRSGNVVHSVMNEHHAINRHNSLLMMAARSIADPERRKVVRDRIIQRYGKMPSILPGGK